jgi:hypothetical protein
MGNSIHPQIARAGKRIIWFNNRLYKNSSAGRLFYQNNIISLILTNYLFANMTLKYVKLSHRKYKYYLRRYSYMKKGALSKYSTYSLRNRYRISFYTLQKKKKVLVYLSFFKKRERRYLLFRRLRFFWKLKYFLNFVLFPYKVIKPAAFI